LSSPCILNILNSDGRREISARRAWGAFLPLAMDIIRCSAAQISRPPEDGFQSDSDSVQRDRSCLSNGSERNDKDDVYLPPGPSSTGVRCQRTHNPLPSGSKRGTSTPSSMSSPPCKSPPTSRRTRGSAPSRNRQAAKDQVEDIRVKLSLCRVRREKLNDLVCPVTDCQYEQLNGRMPDFRRHIKTHIPKEAEIRCKGIQWQDFIRHRRLFPKISVDERPYAVPGEDGLWIGGCLKTFSRADALRRHRRNTSCVALDRHDSNMHKYQ
jgi:hypothetical protein